jgi:hypothetical protein
MVQDRPMSLARRAGVSVCESNVGRMVEEVMDAVTQELIIKAATPLVGVVVGWGLGYWATRRKDRKVERNVRALLRAEIDENATALRGYRASVQERIGTHALTAEHFRLMVQSDSHRLTDLPAWRHQAFEKLFSSLPSALSEEQIGVVSDFHRRLDKLTEIHTKIRNQYRDYGKGNMNALTGIADNWQSFENELNSLIVLGDQLHLQLQTMWRRQTATIRNRFKKRGRLDEKGQLLKD